MHEQAEEVEDDLYEEDFELPVNTPRLLLNDTPRSVVEEEDALELDDQEQEVEDNCTINEQDEPDEEHDGVIQEEDNIYASMLDPICAGEEHLEEPESTDGEHKTLVLAQHCEEPENDDVEPQTLGDLQRVINEQVHSFKPVVETTMPWECVL